MIAEIVREKGWHGLLVPKGKPLVDRWHARCAAIDHAVAGCTPEERAAACEKHADFPFMWSVAAVAKARAILKNRFRKLSEPERERLRDAFQHACLSGQSLLAAAGYNGTEEVAEEAA